MKPRFLPALVLVVSTALLVCVISGVMLAAPNARATNLISATTCEPPGPWTTIAALPDAVTSVAVDTDGSYVYAAGGYRSVGQVATDGLYRYDPAANTWATLAALPDPVYEAFAAYYAGKLYVFGGGVGISPHLTLNYTRIYDVAANTWSYGAAMPAPRKRMAGGMYGGKIYIAGGFNDSSGTGLDVWEYDPASNTWAARALMPQAVQSAGSQSVGGHLYVIGGRNGSGAVLSSVYDYNIAANAWTMRASMLTARFNPGSGVVGGNIWVYGGDLGNGYQPSAVTEVYIPASNSWLAGLPLGTARSGIGGASIGQRLFAIAGWNTLSVSASEAADEPLLPCDPTPTPTSTPPPTSSSTATSTPSPTSTTTPISTPRPTATATPFGTCAPPGNWSVAASLPLPVSLPGVDADGAFVYAAGGYYAGNGVALLARYDPWANTWSSRASMPQAAYEPLAVYAQGRLYVLGGGIEVNPHIPLNYNQVYNIAADTWSNGALLPSPRRRLAGGYYGGEIYVAGGMNGEDASSAQSQLWAYDVSANTWTSRAPMPLAISGATGEVWRGHLYLFGGQTTSGAILDTVLDYDIGAGTWSYLAPMPTPRHLPGSAVVGTSIWVFGGGNPNREADDPDATGVTEIFDPASNVWSTGPSQNIPRSFQGGARVGEYIISVAGWTGVPSGATEVLDYNPLCHSLYLPGAFLNLAGSR